jgi:predicted AlkP superfamily phosphohydrolase/phosphomutase
MYSIRSALVGRGLPNTGTNNQGRTGEHRRDGFCVFAGMGIEPGQLNGPVSLLDLAPTFAALLGVELDDNDGHVLSDVCR